MVTVYACSLDKMCCGNNYMVLSYMQHSLKVSETTNSVTVKLYTVHLWETLTIYLFTFSTHLHFCICFFLQGQCVLSRFTWSFHAELYVSLNVVRITDPSLEESHNSKSDAERRICSFVFHGKHLIITVARMHIPVLQWYTVHSHYVCLLA